MWEHSLSCWGPGYTAERSSWVGKDLSGSAAAVQGDGTRPMTAPLLEAAVIAQQLSQKSQLEATAVHSSLP